mmetsp:Transcript_86713/g.245434  ORF Transcript_86713/g.245434 Transcript_86713/m.245434 type:complete len:108 (-) Transcript_86713:661-984(-)
MGCRLSGVGSGEFAQMIATLILTTLHHAAPYHTVPHYTSRVFAYTNGLNVDQGLSQYQGALGIAPPTGEEQEQIQALQISCWCEQSVHPSSHRPRRRFVRRRYRHPQ